MKNWHKAIGASLMLLSIAACGGGAPSGGGTPATSGTVNGYSVDPADATKAAKLSVSGLDSSNNVIKSGTITDTNVPLTSITVARRVVQTVAAYVPTQVNSVPCGPITGQSGSVAAALTLDSTGSMASTDPPSTAGDTTTTKRNIAAKLFVDRMAATDIAAVSSFDTDTTKTSPYLAIKLWQTFSSSKPTLKTGIDSATFAGGSTNLWDAAFDSTNLVESRTETNKVGIILTDGVDNSSSKTPANVISNATAKTVRLFMIGLSTSSSPLSSAAISNMSNVANSTGGVFAIASDAASLSNTFNGVFNATQGAGCVKINFVPVPPSGVLIKGSLSMKINGGAAITAPFTIQY